MSHVIIRYIGDGGRVEQEDLLNSRVKPLSYQREVRGPDSKAYAQSPDTLVIEVNGTDQGNVAFVYVNLKSVIYVKEIL